MSVNIEELKVTTEELEEMVTNAELVNDFVEKANVEAVSNFDEVNITSQLNTYVEEWCKKFDGVEEVSRVKMDADVIPDLKINQLRLNTQGDLCLLVAFSSDDDSIRCYNLKTKAFECVSGYAYADPNGKEEDWKLHLPKVVMKNVKRLKVANK